VSEWWGLHPTMRPRGLRDEVLRARAAALEGYAFNPTLPNYFDVSSSSSSSRSAPQPKARAEASSMATLLPHNFVVERLPRDAWVCIASFASSTTDLAQLDRCCHSFHSKMGERTTVIADALRLRAAAADGGTAARAPDVDASNAELLREEGLRDLGRNLVTKVDGMRLRLSLDTNSGYHGVTFNEWDSPYRYKACVDGCPLGSFPTAAAAACAVCQFEWVQENPCL
jgi:hypothetical protein